MITIKDNERFLKPRGSEDSGDSGFLVYFPRCPHSKSQDPILSQSVP